ncbi:alpha-crystallin B chain-like [Coccinella septempunctata]|uniref:alpha-crystallin B chain-like n=1 Tax=Coccinella septempunctata TaxID=41139 RepID=UPI001D086011|nr:alpha-crystallin B chain-like [Coccinella septempunctata]
MALLKFFDDPLDYWRPSTLSNQRFGLGLDDEDLFVAAALAPRRIRRLLSHPYIRDWTSRESRNDQGSVVKSNKSGFHVNLDVQQFSPEEISVKVSGENTITIEGKHEEKEDEHGFISRHFVRKYTVPKGYDINKVASKLSTDGVLTISAPKIQKDEEECREIPIQQTGAPVLQKRKSESPEKEDNGVSQMDITEECPRTKKKRTN